MPKAVVITKDNQTALEQQYNLDDDQLEPMIGMVLIADFGESTAVEGYLTQARFTEMYQVTDKKLLNGYMDCVLRPIST